MCCLKINNFMFRLLTRPLIQAAQRAAAQRAQQLAQQLARRREAQFQALVRTRFGSNSSTNPRAVNTRPAGAVVAPRPPSVALFRGRLVYYA